MKRRWFYLVWLVTMLPLSAAEPPRTWTDTQGRTISADFVDANAQEVTVRLENGQMAHIPRSNLSADDLAYADNAQANKPIKVSVEAGRAILSTKTSIASGIQTVSDQTGYNVTVTNQSGLSGQNLRVDYQIYYRQAVQGKSAISQPLHHQGGTETIAKIEGRAKNSFRTIAVTIRKRTPMTVPSKNVIGQIIYSWPNGGHETVFDEIEGIWVRVYQNDKIIGEYLTSDALSKDGWPTDAPATPPAKNSGQKKTPAQPAPASG